MEPPGTRRKSSEYVKTLPTRVTKSSKRTTLSLQGRSVFLFKTEGFKV